MARGNYWSGSKFANLLRKAGGIPAKLGCGTSQEWDEWERSAHAANPTMHWITEEGLSKLQNFFCWPKDKIRDVRGYLSNRFITKTHLAVSDLQKGKWHETETRLLHCMFGLLVEFVEVETAWHSVMWADEKVRKAAGCPRNIFQELLGPKWRSAEIGIAHYEWASKPKAGDTPGANLSRHARSAIEILELYRWWTVTRPNRQDPWFLFNQLSKEDLDDNIGTRRMKRKAAAKKRKGNHSHPESAYQIAMNEVTRLNNLYEAEDEEMMKRLVNIRGALWT